MARRARLRFASAALASAALCSACILDLDHLTSGGTGGATSTSGTIGGAGGATTASSTGTGSAGGTAATSSGTGGAPDPGCPLLDCSCVSGPTVIAAGLPLADSPRGIALTSDGLYWANDQGGTVVHAPKDTGVPQKLVDADTPRAIDVSGSTLVWTARLGLYTCTLPSCESSTHQIFGAAAANSLRVVAFDGQTVVWTDHGSGTNSGQTMACTLGNCSPVTLKDNMVAPEGVTLFGGSAYWVDQGNGNQNGNVARSPTTTSAEQQLAAVLTLPTGVAVDDTYVYWTEWKPGGHVYRCAYNSGYCDMPEDVAPAAGGFPSPRTIRVDGGRIYWTTSDDGSILSCPQPGCDTAMPKVHVTGRQVLQRIAVGSSCLFWTEGGNGGAVMKMPR